MSDKTKITWADASWNVTTGCAKISPGCKHCYAEREWPRLAANPKTRYYGRSFTEVQCHQDVLDQPLHWTRPRRIFVDSMSDLFHENVPARFIADVFAVMAAARRHQFLLLTKRPWRAVELLGAAGAFESDVEEALALYTDADLVWPLPNVKIGVSVEDQDSAHERGPAAQAIATLGWDTWVSYEPALGPVDWRPWLHFLKEAVVGAESGRKARSMHPNHARALRDSCIRADIPFHFKQWGPWLPEEDARARGLNVQHRQVFPDGQAMAWVGTKNAGRTLDGRLWDSVSLDAA